MRFWDASALVPLICEEPRSAACRRLARSDRAIAVWALTRTEIVSAIYAKVRAGELDRTEATAALRRLEALADRWTEVDALDRVRERAERLLGSHPLRSADALQLAAAIVLADERPRRRPFVTADESLGACARIEGFDVTVPRA